MSKLKSISVVATGLTGLVAAAVVIFRRNPRFGSGFVNSVVNPALIEHGIAGRGAAELGTIEHFGRRSGLRRVTPIYPVATEDGFRIMVPLGSHSEWARNVLAAGHCRLQVHDVVYELDEPRMLQPSEATAMPRIVKWVQGYLGFQYIALRRFNSAPGHLDTTEPVEALAVAEGAVAQPEATLEPVSS